MKMSHVVWRFACPELTFTQADAACIKASAASSTLLLLYACKVLFIALAAL